MARLLEHIFPCGLSGEAIQHLNAFSQSWSSHGSWVLLLSSTGIIPKGKQSSREDGCQRPGKSSFPGKLLSKN